VKEILKERIVVNVEEKVYCELLNWRGCPQRDWSISNRGL
jgi:hypothetical protein